jgi:hypothetical protein
MLPGGSSYASTLSLQPQSEENSRRESGHGGDEKQNGGETWRWSQILGAFLPAPWFWTKRIATKMAKIETVFDFCHTQKATATL